MNATEADRIIDRLMWAFTKRKPTTDEHNEWVRALTTVPFDAADREVTAMIEAGSSAPTVAAFMGRMRSRLGPPRPTATPPRVGWVGPTDRGRTLARAARQAIANATPWPQRWHDTDGGW